MQRFRDFYQLGDWADLLESALEYRAFNKWNRLQQIVDAQVAQGVPEDQLWITFSENPRLNVFPRLANKSGKSTPTGIFGFPVKLALERKDNLPTFASRPYMVVFRSTQPIWDIGHTPGDESDLDTEELFARIEPLSYQDLVYSIFQRFENDMPTEFQQKWGNDFTRAMSDLRTYHDSPPGEEWVTNAMQETHERIAREVKENLQRRQIRHTIFRRFIPPARLQGLAATRVWAYLTLRNSEENKLVATGELNTTLQNIIRQNPKLHGFLRFIESGEALKTEEILEFDRLTSFGGGVAPVLQKQKEIPIYEKWIRMFLEKAKKEYETKKGAKDQGLESLNFPRKEELARVAAAHGLSLTMALRGLETYGEKAPKNSKQLVYRVAQQLAQQWAQSENGFDRWPMRWRMLLKELGHFSAADMKDSSAIHSGEPTQGVFLDYRYIKPLAVIPTQPNIDPRVTMGDSFRGHETQHFFHSYKSQRKNQYSPEGDDYYTMTPERKRDYALKRQWVDVVAKFNESLQGYYGYDNLEKQAKSFLKSYLVLKKVLHSDFDQSLQWNLSWDFLREGASTMKFEAYPELKKTLQQIYALIKHRDPNPPRPLSRHLKQVKRWGYSYTNPNLQKMVTKTYSDFPGAEPEPEPWQKPASTGTLLSPIS